MKAITLWRPWPACFTYLDPVAKRIDNRAWETSYRGPVALHAGQRFDRSAFAVARDAVQALGGCVQVGSVVVCLNVDDLLSQDPDHHPTGVVAVADLVDICSESLHSADLRCDCGPWAFAKQRHWRFDNVQALREPVPCVGRQQLWTLPEDVAEQVAAQIEAVAHA